MCITLNLQNIDLNKALLRPLFFYLHYALVYFLNPLHQLIKGHGHPIFNTAILTKHDSAFSKLNDPPNSAGRIGVKRAKKACSSQALKSCIKPRI